MSQETMQALIQWGPAAGDMALREILVPNTGEDEVLLRVAAVGVCGTDVHQLFEGPTHAAKLPITLGHEFAGTVEGVGRGVRGYHEGDRVVSETAASVCGTCALCRAGSYNLCPYRKGFGYGRDGAMAGYVAVPERCLHRLPDSLTFELAALTEPCCVAYNAMVERSSVRPGDSVLVLGPGPIGLLCLVMARLSGATTLIAAGRSADAPRLDLARRLGATITVDVENEDLAEAARGAGDGLGVDVVVDATGASAPFGAAMEAVRPLGQIVKVGWGHEPLGLSLDPIVRKAVSVHGSFSHTWNTWERVIRMLDSGQIPAVDLIGYVGSLEGWRRGFEEMHGGRVAKSVLTP